MIINETTRVPNGQEAAEFAGPPGFEHIESAPRDGTFVRLRFRPGLGREEWEETGRWHEYPDGFRCWRDRDGGLILPGPLFWRSV